MPEQKFWHKQLRSQLRWDPVISMVQKWSVIKSSRKTNAAPVLKKVRKDQTLFPLNSGHKSQDDSGYP